MTDWLIRLRDRPIAEQERRATIFTVAVLLVATTILLAVTQPHEHSHEVKNHIPQRHALVRQAPVTRSGHVDLIPYVSVTAERFLAGYLSYVYGHSPASRVKSAGTALVHSLKSHPPRVPPRAKGLKPRVISLLPAPAPAGLVGVTATVNDGGLIDYRIVLLVTVRDGRPLVTGLRGA